VRGAILLGLLAAGCVATAPAPAVTSLVLQCEKARVVVPAGEPARFDAAGEFTRGEVTVRTAAPSLEVGGEDFSVIAEGSVLVLRTEGGRTFEEGPYQVVILRNGNLLRR
jgi:hypothetical protein